LEVVYACRQVEGLSKRAPESVIKFAQLIDRLMAVAASPVEEILGHVLSETDYRKQFETSEREEDQERLANIEELLTVAREFDERGPTDRALEQFLEETCLTNDVDAWEESNDRVTLMTLHASKGLEFPVVYFVAVEEGLLPHERSRERPDQLEEERRLIFVGITRAQEELHLSMARYRDFRGQRKMTIPSQFLMELPRDEMEVHTPTSTHTSCVWGEPFSEESLHMAADSQFSDEWETPPAPADPVPPAASPVCTPQLTTAAEMAHGGPLPAISPDEFHQDMLVRHPAHGLGRIVALSGSGASRKATVAFPSGQKKFLLTQSPLRPVKK